MSQSRTSKAILFLIALGVVGTVLGGMLTVEHVQLKVTGEGSATCEQLSETGCEITVGEYGSVFAGRLPVSVIGFGGAFTIFALAVLAFVRRRNERDALRSVLFALTSFSVLVSGLMAMVSLMEGAFCPLCVSWYGVNIASCIAAFLTLDRPVLEATKTAFRQIPKQMGATALGMFVLAVGVGWLAYDYSFHERLKEALWEQDMAVLGGEPGEHPNVAAFLKSEIPKNIQTITPDIITPATKTYGSGEKTIRMIEIADLQCPYCQRLWMESKEILENSPLQIEVTFVHLPLHFHEFARKAAEAAECARQQGVAWEFLDLAFQHNDALGHEDLLSYGGKTVDDMERFEACLKDEGTEARIEADKALAAMLGVRGTPQVIIEGFRFPDGMSANRLSKILEKIGNR